MNRIILNLFTVIILGFISIFCASRQKFFTDRYVKDVRNQIVEHLSTSKECWKLQDVKFEINIDENAYVTHIMNISADKKGKCMQDFDNAIRAASPFPMPPKHLTKEAIEEGFVIQFNVSDFKD